MKKRILFYLIIGLFFSSFSCKSFMKGESGDVDSLIKDSEWNIIKSNSIEDIEKRNALLNKSYEKLKKAEEICKKDEFCPAGLYSTFSLYYLFRGEYIQAKKYINIALAEDPNEAYSKVIKVRILLKERGRKYAEEGIINLNKLKMATGSMLAELTLGDCYFYLGNFKKAREVYTGILMTDKGFQTESADRLETIYKIESIKLNPKQIKGVIFSKGVKRDDIAYLMDIEFSVSKYIKKKKEKESKFIDLSSSLYTTSIIKMHSIGMFSYIKGDKFLPFNLISKGEMARIIEDFIVYATGNIGYRSRYKKGEKSSIIDVKSDHPYYNSIRLVIDKKIMDLTLGGSFNPLEPVKGIEVIVTLNRMIKNFRNR